MSHWWREILRAAPLFLFLCGCAPRDSDPAPERHGREPGASATHDWHSSYATAINEAGIVAGRATTMGGRTCALVWENGVANGLRMPRGSTGVAGWGINASGQIAGHQSTEQGDRALLWIDGDPRILQVTGSRSHDAAGINDAGHVVGTFRDSGMRARAFLFADGRVRDLGSLADPAFDQSLGFAVNEQDVVVGVALPTRDTVLEELDVEVHSAKAFLWDRGVMRVLLPDTSINESAAYGVNDAREVVGYLVPGKSGRKQAFVWRAGKVTLLPVPSGWKGSSAHAINNRGQIAGYAEDAENRVRAVMWEDARFRSLGVLPGSRSSQATAINDRGQVTGYATDQAERSRAFVWEAGSMRELPLPQVSECGSGAERVPGASAPGAPAG